MDNDLKNVLNSFNYKVDNMGSLLDSGYAKYRLLTGLDTYYWYKKILGEFQEVRDCILTKLKLSYDVQIYYTHTNTCHMLCSRDDSVTFKADVYKDTPTTVNVYCNGDEKDVNSFKDSILSKYALPTSKASINWMYDHKGNTFYMDLNTEHMPVEEMYPFLGEESLKSYYRRFAESSANILLLIGEPGTGKSTFIRGYLNEMVSSTLLTYDASIIECDDIFAKFIGGSYDTFVIEDADEFLKPRTAGNRLMHKFLNIGDGLVSKSSKKLIFSTNLPSIDNVDSALTREGRCFDILHFNRLNANQASKLADVFNTTVPNELEKYTIAEIFHEKRNKLIKKNSNFGFTS